MPKAKKQEAPRTCYSKLTPSQQQRWKRLSVFPESLDRRAAAAVMECTPEAATELLELFASVDLLNREGDSDRYALPERVRKFAEAEISDEERLTAQYRHSAQFASVLRECDALVQKGDEGIQQGLDLFDREAKNIRAGQAWAASASGTYKAAAKLCDDYPNAGAFVIELRLHPVEHVSWLDAGLKAAQKLKDRQAMGRHLCNLGNVYSDLGQTRKAVKYYEKLLDIARKIGDRREEGHALGNLGAAYAELGQFDKAVPFYEQELEIAREVGDRGGESAALGNLATAHTALGEPEKAVPLFENALRIDRDHGDRRSECENIGNLGNALSDMGETDRALTCYEKQLDFARHIGDRICEALALWNMALEFDGRGQLREAVAHAEQSIKLHEKMGTPWITELRVQYEEMLSDLSEA